MFIVNDKGTSWAYATPGFAASLNPELLKEMRQLAQVPEQAKIITEVRHRSSGPQQNAVVASIAQARTPSTAGDARPAKRAAAGRVGAGAADAAADGRCLFGALHAHGHGRAAGA